MRTGFATLFLLVALAGFVSPAQAQATRTWVSGVGDDANPCSRTAPCKTFAGAISKTAAGGEISVLDPSGYGAVTITKSISITNDNSGEAAILASGTNGINISGAGIIVNLRGLVIDGGPPTLPGLNGIRILNAAAVNVQNCVIKNFTAAPGNGNGLLIQSSGAVKVAINNCVITNNGSADNGAAIAIQAGSTLATVAAEKVVINGGSGFGFRINGGAGGASVSISDSMVTGLSRTAVQVSATGAGQATVAIDRSTISFNMRGIMTAGAAARARIMNTVITGNTSHGVNSSTGVIESLGNNMIRGNSPDIGGTLTPLAPN